MLQPDNDTFHDYRIDSVAYPGFQREGCLRSGGGGWGGGGASGPIYEKWLGGGGGHSASGPIPLGTQKICT